MHAPEAVVRKQFGFPAAGKMKDLLRRYKAERWDLLPKADHDRKTLPAWFKEVLCGERPQSLCAATAWPEEVSARLDVYLAMRACGSHSGGGDEDFNVDRMKAA